MSVDFKVTAESRTDVGKGASRRLRHAGKIPGILYGAEKDPVSLAISHDEMFHHLENEAFYSHILSVSVDGKEEKVVLKDVQRHPGKPKIMHVDFLRISKTQKLHMNVPLHFIGEATAPGVKAGGLVSHLMNNVEVSCLAKDLPEYIEVDVSALETGVSLHLSDIKLPSGVELTALAHGQDHDSPVVNIHEPRGGGDEDSDVSEDASEAEAGGDAE